MKFDTTLKFTDKYEDFLDFFKKTFEENKNDFSKMKKINPYEFIGYFAVFTSQMELLIFNDFLKNHKICDGSFEYFDGDFIKNSGKEIKYDDVKKILSIGKRNFDIEKLTIKLNDLSDRKWGVNKVGEILSKGFWNSLIHPILDSKPEFGWFKEVRKYRNELIHMPDSGEEPFKINAQNFFKTKDSVFSIRHFLRLSWELFNFNKSVDVESVAYKDFFQNYAATFGFVILYNSASRKELNIREITTKNSSGESKMGSGLAFYKEKPKVAFEYKVIGWGEGENWSDSIYSQIDTIDIFALQKIGIEVNINKREWPI